MAEAVARAIEHRSVLVAEAGTGTGKTLAYLVPALLSGDRVIISTGTKNLQDQLFFKDLPLVRNALGVPARISLLKGRANYLCRHRLDHCEDNPRFRPHNARELRQVRQWADTTREGDVAELRSLAEDAAIWPFVTSSADNCLGQECPEIGKCHVMRARRMAQEADIVVVNHHLFFADLSLREEGVAELLPGAHAVIFDEAHQLAEVASSFFGIALGTGQLLELAGDSLAAVQREAPDVSGLDALTMKLEHCVHDFRRLLPQQASRMSWRDALRLPDMANALEAMRGAVAGLTGALEQVSERGKDLESCAQRAEVLRERLRMLTGDTPGDHIHWLALHARSAVFNLTPLDVAGIFREHMQARPCAWIFTSATLSVGGNFQHFSRTLGIEDAECLAWDSPFDYGRQALLYVPGGLPDPSDRNYTREVVNAALPVMEASGGRTFLLFTSHRALQEAAGLLQGRIPYPLLIQGTMPRSQLLARFRELGNAVLLGTSSFWEGVDVRGEALSCVIIDKLPFASPGDPVMQARMDAIRERGGNPFQDHQLPQAVITLRQGVGRLIRDVDDRGVLMVCDPRLLQKSYGRVFLKSLPAMARTRDIKQVGNFFAMPAPYETTAMNS